jgi:hypothetical protein
MSHHFSNSSRIRESIRQQSQAREWQDIPVEKRIQILERVSEVIEQVLMGNRGELD